MRQLSIIAAATACLLTASAALSQNARPPVKKPFSPEWQVFTKDTVYSKANPPATPKLDELPLQASVTQYGITWTFDKPAHVGQFVNGDYYVVGPVTVTELSPKPLYGDDIPADQLDSRDKSHPVEQRVHNGFMVNPPAKMEVAYDSGTRNWFDPSLIQKLPVTLKAGDSMVATISMPMGLKINAQLRNTYERGDGDSSPTRIAAVLTCVADPLPPDAFRPGYCDRQARIYLARDLKRELLPTVAKTPALSENYLKEFEGFTQKPWVATGFFSFEQPLENMPAYGREYGRVSGISALILCTDLTPEQKEPLLINYVQVGIDLGTMIRNGHPGWEAFGGHGSGRKLPIVFAGILLGDDQLANINKSFPKAHFGEDEQTAYGDCWTGAKVVFTGHRAVDEATGIARSGSGPYEQKQPKDWTGAASGPREGGDRMSEAYRRCCTSITWIAQALVLHLMHAEKQWDHPAFFDYCDRWMYEKEAPILKAAGLPAEPDWASEGQTWDDFVNQMWAKYRTSPGMPPTDGWQKQHDDSYLKNAIEMAAKNRER